MKKSMQTKEKFRYDIERNLKQAELSFIQSVMKSRQQESAKRYNELKRVVDEMRGNERI